MITNYVVGFAFDQYGAVALINKNKPAWQKGKWNGVGGHIEPTDPSTRYAIAREFHEETAMYTQPEQWRHVGRSIESDAVVQIFTARVPLLHVHTNTAETVRVFPEYDQLMLGGDQFPCIPNLPVYLEMCKLGVDRHGVIPFFTIDYTCK